MAFRTAARSSPSPSGASSSTMRAVERQQHAVEPARRGQALEERVLHVVERLPGHRARGHGVRGDRRDHLGPGGDEDVEESAHLGPGAAEPGQDLVSVEELGGAEVVQVRLLADEGVRLLHELPDRDPHRGLTSTRAKVRGQALTLRVLAASGGPDIKVKA